MISFKIMSIFKKIRTPNTYDITENVNYNEN